MAKTDRTTKAQGDAPEGAPEVAPKTAPFEFVRGKPYHPGIPEVVTPHDYKVAKEHNPFFKGQKAEWDKRLDAYKASQEPAAPKDEAAPSSDAPKAEESK